MTETILHKIQPTRGIIKYNDDRLHLGFLDHTQHIVHMQEGMIWSVVPRLLVCKVQDQRTPINVRIRQLPFGVTVVQERHFAASKVLLYH